MEQIAPARPEWIELAECRGMDPNLFVPSKGQPIHQAKAVCEGCSVKAECAEYAIPDAELQGVWGGMSEDERRAERAKRRIVRRRNVPPAQCGTHSGFSRHIDRNEQPCPACREAHNAYQREYRERRKALHAGDAA